METAADTDGALLTRRNTSFRQIGELYRREVEVHQLQLVEPEEMVTLLEHIGFSVERFTSYGPLTLPVGLEGYLARKAP